MMYRKIWGYFGDPTKRSLVFSLAWGTGFVLGFGWHTVTGWQVVVYLGPFIVDFGVRDKLPEWWPTVSTRYTKAPL